MSFCENTENTIREISEYSDRYFVKLRDLKNLVEELTIEVSNSDNK